jgi:CDP-diacylglycerol--serine O-phosphatidyltransferase
VVDNLLTSFTATTAKIMTEEKTPSKGIYLLPNLLTTGAMFCGFYAIVAGMNAKFELAAVAVFIAMILDGLDGRVARMTHTQTEFGAEYDSLSDLISFGLAPALVMYQWALVDMQSMGTAWGKAGWLAAFIYVACAALRLARFNTQIGKVDKRYFIGLPSPAAAAIMVGMVWFFNDIGVQGEEVKLLAFGLSIFAGLLMVSNLRFYSFKDFDLKNKVPFLAILLIVLVFALTTIDPPKVLFAVFMLYSLSGPVMWLVHRYKQFRQS